MAHFGLRSAANLAQCHPSLRLVAEMAIKIVDFSILCGHRGEAEQVAAVLAKPPRSKAQWLQSPHNYTPALAFDFAPWPTDWDNTQQFAHYAGIMIGIGLSNGVSLTWGGAWGWDLPHIQMTNWKDLRGA